MRKILIAAIIGLIFGAGIAVSGMANPAKVLNFFDFYGTWDPSLAFVMGGALVVTALGYRFVLKRPAPMLDSRFHLPTGTKIDTPLIAGSALFLGEPDALIFVAAMAAGIFATRQIRIGLAARTSPQNA